MASHQEAEEPTSRSLDCADFSTKRLIRRAAPLTFGIFGTIGSEEREVWEGGSGIFVAPFLAITARHVTDDLYRLTDHRESPRQPHQSQHAAHLFQVLDPFNPDVSTTSLWHVDRSWRSPHTDITLLKASAESDAAKQSEMESKFFEWCLSPPPIGSTVSAIGFPLQSVKPDGKHVNVNTPFQVRVLHVAKVHPCQRDKGMMNFPCFEVDDAVGPGFSGGPVFYEDKLCGIVSSGSSFDRRSYIASLWPLTLMDYSNELGEQTRFGDLFDRDVIVANDWPEIRKRISKGKDDLGNPYVFIKASGLW